MKKESVLLWHSVSSKTTMSLSQKLGIECNADGFLHLNVSLEQLTFALAEMMIEEQQKPSVLLEQIAQLSPKEKAVLWHTALQKTDEEIGDVLCIAKGTVHKHHYNMICKLHLKGCRALRKLAVEYKAQISTILSINSANNEGGNIQKCVLAPIKYTFLRIDRYKIA